MKSCLGPLIAILPCTSIIAEETAPRIDIQSKDGTLVIRADDRPIATYIYADSEIPRPYFAHLKAPGGRQVTRNHPPIQGKDRTDHATMHPGIWMAFGDLDGSDFWRNKAKIVHAGFLKQPESRLGSGMFVQQKHYLRADNALVCREEFRCSIHSRPGAYLLIWDSTFSAESEFYFGDQEEMGLGLRVTTPISEMSGGQLSDSAGRQGAQEIWSNGAAWCDYSGIVDGQRIGITLMCHPENFRESWMHARNYGLLAANPFGRQAMKKGQPSKVVVKPGETLRLRYGIWIHAGDSDKKLDCHSAYKDYLEIASEGRRRSSWKPLGDFLR